MMTDGDWNDVSVNQERPRIAGNSRKLEEARRVPPPGLRRNRGFADTLISDLQPPELGANQFLCVQPPDLRHFDMEAQGDYYSVLLISQARWVLSRLRAPAQALASAWDSLPVAPSLVLLSQSRVACAPRL